MLFRSNLEDAEATADALIDSIWLTTNTDSIGWNYEQMDLYSDSAYATALQDEQYLRQNSTAENKLIAAKEYVSATNTHIEAVNEAKPDFAGFIIEVSGRRRSLTAEQVKVLVKGSWI